MSHESDVETMTVLLGVTGSVAAVKAPEIALRLVQEDLAVKILLTKGGRHFWDQSRNYSPSVWEAFEKELRRTHGEGSSRIEVIGTVSTRCGSSDANESFSSAMSAC
jgi:hypothetical protein